MKSPLIVMIALLAVSQLFWVYLPAWARAASGYLVCPGLRVQGPNLGFSEEEQRLLCGDAQSPAWKRIPDNQRLFYLRTFLQSRGYFQPRFPIADGEMILEPGDQTRVRKFQVVGKTANFPVSHLRKIVGEILTPDLLDNVKKRVQEQLALLGYACAQVRMEANGVSGELTAHVDSGEQKYVANVAQEGVPGLDDRLFRRYDAFQIGNRFNLHTLTITENRTLDQGIVQSTHIENTCTETGVDLGQRFVPGPPRLLQLAGGFDTEQILLFRGSWKNTRMGKYGSSLLLETEDSFRNQSLLAKLTWYYLPFPSRHYLLPSVSLRHENIDPYDKVTATFQVAPALSWDSPTTGYNLYAGPRLTLTRNFRGPGPSYSRFLSLGSEFQMTDHDFEYYRNSPRSGYALKLQGNFTEQGIWSDITAQQVVLDYTHLWNYRSYDPPLWVFGFRTYAATTLTSETNASDSPLPSEFRSFLGGSPDLRGFGYRELPDNDQGGLTALTFSLEARLADGLPFGLQPFAFLDTGWFGNRSVSLDWPLYWSPGVGIRWQSSFGVIRSTLAHGFIDGEGTTAAQRAAHSHLQFYFSFGEEF